MIDLILFPTYILCPLCNHLRGREASGNRRIVQAQKKAVFQYFYEKQKFEPQAHKYLNCHKSLFLCQLGSYTYLHTLRF